MTIRPERPEEFQAIELLIREAFLTAEVSGGDEHRFAARRRADGNYLPGLALELVPGALSGKNTTFSFDGL